MEFGIQVAKFAAQTDVHAQTVGRTVSVGHQPEQHSSTMPHAASLQCRKVLSVIELNASVIARHNSFEHSTRVPVSRRKTAPSHPGRRFEPRKAASVFLLFIVSRAGSDGSLAKSDGLGTIAADRKAPLSIRPICSLRDRT